MKRRCAIWTRKNRAAARKAICGRHWFPANASSMNGTPAGRRPVWNRCWARITQEKFSVTVTAHTRLRSRQENHFDRLTGPSAARIFRSARAEPRNRWLDIKPDRNPRRMGRATPPMPGRTGLARSAAGPTQPNGHGPIGPRPAKTPTPEGRSFTAYLRTDLLNLINQQFSAPHLVPPNGTPFDWNESDRSLPDRSSN